MSLLLACGYAGLEMEVDVNENVKKPKVRFKGYEDAWEQRKVSDLLVERNDQAPMSDEYPLMAFIANQGVAPKGERYDRSALVNDEVGKKYKRTEYGDFIYSSNNLETGSIGLNKYGNACISPVYSIFKPTGVADLDFLGRRFLRKDFINEMVKWRQGVVYGQWKIHEADFLKIEVTVPSKEEQKKIGQYLDNLDDLITLHQRECEQAKKYKKYMLQKMFPQNGSNVPEIRFSGFTYAWEQRKLGNVCSRVQGNDGRMELPTLTISAGNGWMRQEDRFSGNIAGKEQRNYTLLHRGELSYNHGNSKLAKYGAVFSLQTYEEALVPRVYHSFKVENGDADFVEYYFATKLPDKELGKLISSGARMDGLLNIGYEEFMGIPFLFPNEEEQSKISSYFRTLDHLITLHQQKCEELQKIKKFMLQNMFV